MTTALDFNPPHLIRNEEEYDAIVAEVERLLDKNPREGSPADEKIEFLSVLIEHYDQRHNELPGGDVTPQEVVAETLAQKGLTRAHLADVMGGRSRVSEFFSGARVLSMTQVLKLRVLLGVPADLLVGPIEARVTKAARPSDRTRRTKKAHASVVAERKPASIKKTKPKATSR